MKTKLFVVQIIVLSIIILISGCNESGLTDTGSTSVRYLFFTNSGCLTSHKLAKANSDATLDWQYLNGRLKVKVTFTTLCSAILKDSVVVSKDSINIFLKDTNEAAAECVCPYNEEFNFQVIDKKELKIFIYFKQYFKKEYHVLAGNTIKL